MNVSAKIIIKGYVQGVGYRFFVYQWANRLGLKGYAKNLYNGNVEVQVEGERSLIEELIKELKIGPRSAHVSDVNVEWEEPTFHFNNFEIY